ncbi:MAG: hypothetical protein ACT4QD_07950 [Acidobacteriota bacterium]
MLLAAMVVSLVVALVASLTAWRLTREQRARSDARVAALAAAAESEEPSRQATPRRALETEEVGSVPVAVGHARAMPRPIPFASEFAASARQAVRDVERSPVGPVVPATALAEGFLNGGAQQSDRRQHTLAFAAFALFVVVVAGGYWAVFAGGAASPSGVAAPSLVAPVELVSLRHERRAGRLAVTGLVRNPAAGAPVGRLSAVVFLFDQQGAFLKSARADVDFLTLAPGDESPFVIEVDAPTSVARYRVSFRNSDGVVPHVDRRGQAPVSTAIAGDA